MSNAAHLLPARLREAAAAIANARAGRRGAPAIANVLDVLPENLFADVVEDARAALDAADDAAPAQPASGDPSAIRIGLAAAVGLDLGSQATVILDVARDGIVTVSTWAARAGTASLAISEWAKGLHAHAISVVPFQTVFGWGRGGRPTPLTEAQRASLGEQGQAYADRNSVDPAHREPRPLDTADAEFLGSEIDAGTLLIVARDKSSLARAVLWDVCGSAKLLEHDQAHALWGAVAPVLRIRPASPDHQELNT